MPKISAQSESQFELLVQAVVDYAIFMVDLEGRVTNWNSGAQRIKGYAANEIVGRHFSVFYTKEDQQTGLPAKSLETAKTAGRCESEGWRVRQDGTRFWANVVIDPVRDESGRLLAFAKVTRDITERRTLEREKDESLRQKDLLLQEINHRVNNSMQIIASILMMKALRAQSEETRTYLQEAHDRVMAVATVQEQLSPSHYGAEIEVRTYLTRLCESLAMSMIVDRLPVSLRVEAGVGSMTSEHAVSMGLIATELVINSLKHAFPDGAQGAIVVAFEANAGVWRLSVSDDGVGVGGRPLPDAPVKRGLGTSIVEALTQQLGGNVATSAGSPGTIVSMTVPRAASHLTQTRQRPALVLQ